jgi:hypothetical protein
MKSTNFVAQALNFFMALLAALALALLAIDLANGVAIGTAYRVLKEIGLLQTLVMPALASTALVLAGILARDRVVECRAEENFGATPGHSC